MERTSGAAGKTRAPPFAILGLPHGPEASVVIVPEFRRFREEGIIIGRLLAGYGSLESALSSCVAMARNDIDMVLKAMFRTRGETQRVEIADAMRRPVFRAIGLENMFSETIGDMRYCLKIRNQFSHCQWHDDGSGNLCFVDMEEIAKSSAVITDLRGLTFHYVELALLILHEAYFIYTADCLLYLNYEGRLRAGTIASHERSRPRKVTRPPLHILH